MTTGILVYVMLIGPPPGADGAPIAALRPTPWTAEELRAQFDDLTLRTARVRSIDAEHVAPDLLTLYGALYQENDLPGAELVDLRRRTKSRLETVRDKLRREQRRANSQPLRGGATAFGGGMPLQAGEFQNAQALIALIEETIEPESWETNGGPGSIRYYSPLHLLVVRNSQHVHEQIGGALGDLK